MPPSMRARAAHAGSLRSDAIELVSAHDRVGDNGCSCLFHHDGIHDMDHVLTDIQHGLGILIDLFVREDMPRTLP